MNFFPVAAFLITTIVTLTVTRIAHAIDDQPEPIAIANTFARPIERTPPKYPKSAQRRGQEGWVDLSFVVQPDGTITDPIVENSSGIFAFEQQALKTVTQWKYEPATRNGIPVEQSQTKVRLTFAFEGKSGARSSFISFFKKIQKLIANDDLDSATALLKEQREKGRWNLYEYSQLWLLRAQIAHKQGDEHVQLEALYRAGGRTANFIEEDLFEKMLATMLHLELKLSRYSSAFETYDVLKKYPDFLENNEQLVTAVKILRDHIRSNTILSVPGEISELGGRMIGWNYRLLRREFAFDTIYGVLQRLELRCDWKAFSDVILQDVAWQIPKSWGKCKLFVYGTIGTKFRLLEYSEVTDSQSRSASPPDGTYAFSESVN